MTGLLREKQPTRSYHFFSCYATHLAPFCPLEVRRILIHRECDKRKEIYEFPNLFPNRSSHFAPPSPPQRRRRSEQWGVPPLSPMQYSPSTSTRRDHRQPYRSSGYSARSRPGSPVAVRRRSSRSRSESRSRSPPPRNAVRYKGRALSPPPSAASSSKPPRKQLFLSSRSPSPPYLRTSRSPSPHRGRVTARDHQQQAYALPTASGSPQHTLPPRPTICLRSPSKCGQRDSSSQGAPLIANGPVHASFEAQSYEEGEVVRDSKHGGEEKPAEPISSSIPDKGEESVDMEVDMEISPKRPKLALDVDCLVEEPFQQEARQHEAEPTDHSTVKSAVSELAPSFPHTTVPFPVLRHQQLARQSTVVSLDSPVSSTGYGGRRSLDSPSVSVASLPSSSVFGGHRRLCTEERPVPPALMQNVK